jgi:ABC-type transport system involved in multi-copper enzyme maturation permease subunit
MMPLLRAEVRKLFTIRSTYVILSVGLLLVGFVSFWVFGVKEEAALPSERLQEIAATAAVIIATFIAITAVLMVAHEYRYNTIMYTLTSANSRSKVLLAKILVASGYVLVTTLFVMLYAMLLCWLGYSVVGGHDMGAQHIDYWGYIWRSLFFVWGYTMVGMLVAVLFRHVVGAIVVLLIVPTTVEGLLGLVLKENVKYLPFSSLEQVHTGSTLDPGKAALVFGGYLLVGYAIAWYLFLKRDAN